MNWHQTIIHIRTLSEFKDLIKDAYFDEDLRKNIENFRASKEYAQTLNLLRKYASEAKDILDIGAGNGISAVNFALDGYSVTAIEPDPSDTVGANAIRNLANEYQLDNLQVYEKFAEDINFPDETFDIVYVRQALHHAHHLQNFVKEASRVLKKGGILITIRDHVIFNLKDKEAFFKTHPLHKFYGGENAYKAQEYKDAFKAAGLKVELELKYFDSEINYSPFSAESIKELKQTYYNNLVSSFKKKLGFLSSLPLVFQLYKFKNGYRENDDTYFERMVHGRMYSYISRK